MLPSSNEPRNPLYLLLLLVGVVFVVTAFAYAVIPVLEQKAIDAGEPPPPSAFRDALRQDGWKWLLYQVTILIVVGLASMAVDRLRSLQKPASRRTIPPEACRPSTPNPVAHEQEQDQTGRDHAGPTDR